MLKFNIIPIPQFEKDIKNLSKKFHKIGEDVDDIINELEKGNLEGSG